ncbi:MAG: agmatine deiminase family protein [Cellulomonas sp.]|nr:agmatine deiminase family protein [Cellulomonas sp.]
MPAETERHVRTWMAWPSGGYTLGDDEAAADAARSTWAAVASAVHRFEPVSMLVDPADVDLARRYLPEGVEVHPVPLDDAWMRDMGPTFVAGPDGPVAVCWVFNGWGAQGWARWDRDTLVGRAVAGLADVPTLPSTLVAEGGGLHTDGAGTFLVTETVMLDPGRNPGWTREQVDAELTRTLGARTVIWLPRGLTRDSERFGTRGHVDLVATFASPGHVLVHRQRDPAHPDFEVTAQVTELLQACSDADGRPLRVTPVPAPATLRDDAGWVDWSYLNHYVVNGGVVAGTFDDPNDAQALALLADAYAGRQVVAVDARPLFERGGGVHCLTQQQPAAAADGSSRAAPSDL